MCGICQIWDTPHIWQTLVTNPKIRDVNFYATSVYRSPYLTNPTHIWQTPPHLTNPTHIWQTPPIYDKSPHIWQIPPRSDKSNWKEFFTGVCRIWAPIYYGTVKVDVANNWSFSVLSIWARHFPIFDKSKWQTSTEYFSKGDPLQLLKWWNRALWLAEKRSHGQFRGLSLVESTACVFHYQTESRGVCQIWVGFVKSWILPIYDKPWWQIPYNNYSRRISSRYRNVRGPYLTNPDKPQQLSPI